MRFPKESAELFVNIRKLETKLAAIEGPLELGIKRGYLGHSAPEGYTWKDGAVVRTEGRLLFVPEGSSERDGINCQTVFYPEEITSLIETDVLMARAAQEVDNHVIPWLNRSGDLDNLLIEKPQLLSKIPRDLFNPRS